MQFDGSDCQGVPTEIFHIFCPSAGVSTCGYVPPQVWVSDLRLSDYLRCLGLLLLRSSAVQNLKLLKCPLQNSVASWYHHDHYCADCADCDHWLEQSVRQLIWSASTGMSSSMRYASFGLGRRTMSGEESEEEAPVPTISSTSTAVFREEPFHAPSLRHNSVLLTTYHAAARHVELTNLKPRLRGQKHHCSCLAESSAWPGRWRVASCPGSS